MIDDIIAARLHEKESIEALEKIIRGDFNTISYVQDLVDHYEMANSRQKYLAWLVKDIDLDYLLDLDPMIGILEGSQNVFSSINDVDKNSYAWENLLALEAAFNIVRKYPDDVILEDDYVSHTKAVLDEYDILDGHIFCDTLPLRRAYGPSWEDHLSGQWATRNTIATYLESVPTSFRLRTQFNVNPESGFCLMNVCFIPYQCFKIVTSDPAEQIRLGNIHVLKTMALAAQIAFKADSVQKVCIQIQDQIKGQILATCQMRREDLHEFIGLVDSSEDGLIEFDGLDYQLNLIKKLKSIDEKYRLDSEIFAGPEAYEPIRLKEDTPADLKNLLQIDSLSDLRTNQHDLLLYSWKQTEKQLQPTCQQTVSTLITLKDSSGSKQIEDACNRCIKGLIEGDLDCTDIQGIRHEFLYGEPFLVAYEQISSKLEDSFEEEKDLGVVVEVVQDYKRLIDSVVDSGALADTDNHVFRWFETVAGRIAYNLAHKDDPRQVFLISEAYYHALKNHIVLSLLIHEPQIAEESVKELRRIAPTSADATLLIAKYYAQQSKMYEALEVTQEVLTDSLDYSTSAYMLYRQAFLNWKTGNIKLATAMYSQILGWPDTGVGKNAAEEMAEMFKENDTYGKVSVDELKSFLEESGYTICCDKTGDALLESASILALDNGLFRLAAAIMASTARIFDITTADVATALLNSLQIDQN